MSSKPEPSRELQTLKAEFFRALAHPARIRLLEVLSASGAQNVQALSARHGVMVRDVLLVPAGSIPRTSSGKIARRACRAAYLEGTLRGGYTQTAFPDAVDEE